MTEVETTLLALIERAKQESAFEIGRVRSALRWRRALLVLGPAYHLSLAALDFYLNQKVRGAFFCWMAVLTAWAVWRIYANKIKSGRECKRMWGLRRVMWERQLAAYRRHVYGKDHDGN